MRRVGAAVAVLAMLGATILIEPVAAANTVSGAGTAYGHRYRGDTPDLGGVTYTVSVQVNRDPANQITAVRGAGRLTKLSKASRVQVDRVALSSTSASAAVTTISVNSGTASSVIEYTKWVGIAPGSCFTYRVRVNYSVRWIDGGLSRFNQLSPATKVCGPTAPPKYVNCPAMNAAFPHGVGRPGSVDSTSRTKVSDYYRSAYIYSGNVPLDRDRDGIACEKN